MTELSHIESPLVAGPTRSLESLFADWLYVPVDERNGRHYPAPDGYTLFCGLPGTLGRDRALFVLPHEAVRVAAESRLANGVIGSFRCVRSARYMKDDLLPVYVTDPQPISAEQFGVAHDPEFVADILSGRRRNGFGNRSPAVAASLPLTSGAMLSAAREALRNEIGAIAPCSGFHHAGYDFAGGYCTFKGLMVTAAVLLAEGKARKVGILDFDQHWGNGTQDIIDRLRLGEAVVHYSPGEYSRPGKAEAFLATIRKLLERFAGCDLVLYQAGADPHIDDPLGGWLTTEQLYRRDRTVFEWLRRLAIPVAWNLAGGYQRDMDGSIRPVLDIHDNTLVAFVEAHGHAEIPASPFARKEAA